TCHVHYDAHTMIEVEYLSGPFKTLNNRWDFTPVDGGKACQIDFYIGFEFKSRMLATLASGLFHEVVRRMVGAFEDRADTLYSRTP
ncbi:MAG: type II toxin-antitoxin system RatA family toxin, partial [Cyanobacteria bacterium J06649_11]